MLFVLHRDTIILDDSLNNSSLLCESFQEGNVGTGDQVILVGAASKGIIQRDFQHHAVVYKTPYAKNPFDSITNEELEDYKRTIERKNRGEGMHTRLLEAFLERISCRVEYVTWVLLNFQGHLWIRTKTRGMVS